MAKEPRGFRSYRTRAARLLGQPAEIARLVSRARDKLADRGAVSDALAQVRDEITTFGALLKAWRAGEYTGIERSSMILIAAALLYFVVPVDVIPDVIVGLGFVDDAAIVGYVFTRLREEIEAFRAWQALRQPSRALEELDG